MAAAARSWCRLSFLRARKLLLQVFAKKAPPWPGKATHVAKYLRLLLTLAIRGLYSSHRSQRPVLAGRETR